MASMAPASCRNCGRRCVLCTVAFGNGSARVSQAWWCRQCLLERLTTEVRARDDVMLVPSWCLPLRECTTCGSRPGLWMQRDVSRNGYHCTREARCLHCVQGPRWKPLGHRLSAPSRPVGCARCVVCHRPCTRHRRRRCLCSPHPNGDWLCNRCLHACPRCGERPGGGPSTTYYMLRGPAVPLTLSGAIPSLWPGHLCSKCAGGCPVRTVAACVEQGEGARLQRTVEAWRVNLHRRRAAVAEAERLGWTERRNRRVLPDAPLHGEELFFSERE